MDPLKDKKGPKIPGREVAVMGYWKFSDWGGTDWAELEGADPEATRFGLECRDHTIWFQRPPPAVVYMVSGPKHDGRVRVYVGRRGKFDGRGGRYRSHGFAFPWPDARRPTVEAVRTLAADLFRVVPVTETLVAAGEALSQTAREIDRRPAHLNDQLTVRLPPAGAGETPLEPGVPYPDVLQAVDRDAPDPALRPPDPPPAAAPPPDPPPAPPAEPVQTPVLPDPPPVPAVVAQPAPSEAEVLSATPTPTVGAPERAPAVESGPEIERLQAALAARERELAALEQKCAAVERKRSELEHQHSALEHQYAVDLRQMVEGVRVELAEELQTLRTRLFTVENERDNLDRLLTAEKEYRRRDLDARNQERLRLEQSRDATDESDHEATVTLHRESGTAVFWKRGVEKLTGAAGSREQLGQLVAEFNKLSEERGPEYSQLEIAAIEIGRALEVRDNERAAVAVKVEEAQKRADLLTEQLAAERELKNADGDRTPHAQALDTERAALMRELNRVHKEAADRLGAESAARARLAETLTRYQRLTWVFGFMAVLLPAGLLALSLWKGDDEGAGPVDGTPKEEIQPRPDGGDNPGQDGKPTVDESGGKGTTPTETVPAPEKGGGSDPTGKDPRPTKATPKGSEDTDVKKKESEKSSATGGDGSLAADPPVAKSGSGAPAATTVTTDKRTDALERCRCVIGLAQPSLYSAECQDNYDRIKSTVYMIANSCEGDFDSVNEQPFKNCGFAIENCVCAGSSCK